LSLTIKTLIVSEIRLLGEALAEVIGRAGEMCIAGLAQDAALALELAAECQPDVVLLDAAVPYGTSLVQRIGQIAPRAAIIILAVAETEESVLAWAEAGARGYIPKTAALADIVSMIADIIGGAQPSSSRVTASLLRRVAATGPSSLAPRRLTCRELEIMKLVSLGLSNKEIARKLDIGVATTKAHVHNVLGKLKLSRRTEIIALISDPPADEVVHFNNVRRNGALLSYAVLPAHDDHGISVKSPIARSRLPFRERRKWSLV
jgi:two-component system nitrate/nitrite response regulator NarL